MLHCCAPVLACATALCCTSCAPVLACVCAVHLYLLALLGWMASCTNGNVWVERALLTLVSHPIHYEYVRVCCILTPDVRLVVWRAAQIILSASSHSCTSDLASLAVGASIAVMLAFIAPILMLHTHSYKRSGPQMSPCGPPEFASSSVHLSAYGGPQYLSVASSTQSSQSSSS